MTNLGVMYHKGQGVPVDYVAARNWYEKAAPSGSSDAMINLGLIYEKGLGVPIDPVHARHWYEKAAAAGHLKATDYLMRLEQASGPKHLPGNFE